MSERMPPAPVPASTQRGEQEQTRVPERPSLFHGLIALQARLLHRDYNALSPQNTTLSEVTQDTFAPVDQRTQTYQIIHAASTGERVDYWRDREDNDYERQKQVWVNNTVSTFTEAQPFFTQSAQGRQWSQALSRIGMNPAEVNADRVNRLYDTFFTGNRRESQIKLFVQHVVHAYRDGNSVNHQQLRQDLPAIQWIANIFGNNYSYEIVAQLIDAEVKLITEPQPLIEAANQREQQNNQEVLRINRLLPREVELLRFLWGYQEGPPTAPPPPQPPTPEPTRPPQPPPPAGGPQPSTPEPTRPPHRTRRLPDGFRWTYKRFGPQRQFPGRHEVQTWLSPHHIAHHLKERYPQRYGTVPPQQLAHEIEAEQQKLHSAMSRVGLNVERYNRQVEAILDNYKRFLKNRYDIDIPVIGHIRIQPITGKTAEYYNPWGAFALVHTTHPIMFVDMGTVAAYARRMGIEEWQKAPNPQQLGDLIERLLNEIHPHEYTHLISDIAYWQLLQRRNGAEELVETLPAKAGVDALKPRRVTIGADGEPHIEFISRGGGLTEAITTELTNEWAQSRRQRLDINAYAYEREVLDELVGLLAREQHISGEESFKKFAHGYFHKKDYLQLVKEIDGREVRNGKVTYKRPHLLSIVYALMSYEQISAHTMQTVPDYSLTKSYIRNSLSAIQKQSVRQLLQSLNVFPDIFLSPAARQTLDEKAQT